MAFDIKMPTSKKRFQSSGGNTGMSTLMAYMLGQQKSELGRERNPTEIVTGRTDPLTGEKTVTPEGIQALGDIKRQEKLSTEEANVQFGAKKEASSSRRFVQQFDRSYQELKRANPHFDEPTFSAGMSRLGLGIKTAFRLMPETRALQIRIQPLANQMAVLS